MQKLTREISDHLLNNGATLVGFADLSVLPENERYSQPFGVSIGVVYSKETIATIAEYPTSVYLDEYNAINVKLNELGKICTDKLTSHGYSAIARTSDVVEDWQNSGTLSTMLPHKTAARLAGLGWIGKSALLVNETYGSMVRYMTVLTNAPVDVANPISTSKCGDCLVCTSACPGGAIQGRNWEPGMSRSEIFDALVCQKTARARSLKNIGHEMTICGKCIYVCPHTQRYLNSK